MPEDRTTDQPPPIEPVAPRRPDRIVRYANRGPRQLAVVIAVIFALMVAVELLFYEVLSDRGSLTGNVVRGLVKALLPIGLVIYLVRVARRRG